MNSKVKSLQWDMPTFDYLISEFQTDPNVLAVVLIGSASRGEMDAFSDVDVLVILDGERPPDRFYFHDGRFHTVNFLDRHNRELMLTDPWYAMWNILPTRNARILLDSQGWYANLQAQAMAFNWSQVQAKANVVVDHLILTHVEYVFKVLSGLSNDNLEKALVATLALTTGMTNVAVMARGTMILRENKFFSTVAMSEPDEQWGKNLWVALGMNAQTVETRAIAALKLYARSVELYAECCQAKTLEVAQRTVAQITTSGLV